MLRARSPKRNLRLRKKISANRRCFCCMNPLSKQITTVLVLSSFLAIAFFSFVLMTHGPDGRMPGDCPLSTMGVSLCPQDTVAIAIHHISSYHAFLNVPVGVGLTALIISLLFALFAVFAIFIRSTLLGLGPPLFARVLYNSPPADPHSRETVRWLSLFENSPSRF